MTLDSTHRTDPVGSPQPDREAATRGAGDRGDHRSGSGSVRDGVATGLLVVVAGVIGIMVAMGEVFLDVIPFLVAFVALALWSARSGSRLARWITVALLTVMLAVNSVYAAGDLSHPESAAAFIATSVVMGGGVVTIVLAVLSALRRPASGGRVWAVAAAALVALAGMSLVAAAQVDDAVARAGDEVVTAAEFEYPEEIRIDSGAGLVIDNDDMARHTFVVDGPDGTTVEVPAGSTARTEVDLDPGTYRFYCDIPGHEEMQGILEVS